MSDGSTKYNYPSIVGDMGNGSGMLLANRPPMSTLPSSSSMIMSVAEHARSLSSPSAHSLNLPYTAQPHPGSPPPSIMRSVSPAMSVQPSTNVPFSAMQSNEWDARTTDVVSPMGVVTPTGMLTPTGMISPTGMYSSSGDEPTQALSDDTISPVSPPRARLNPPAYSRHADSPPETVAGASVPFAAPEIPEGGIVPYDVRSTGHARGGQTEKGSSDTSFSNTSYSNTSYSTFHASAGDRNTSVGSVDQMNGLLGNLGLGSDAGESTYDGASEGGETYPSSVLGGMSSRLGPSTPRKSAMGRDMKLATPMEDHREDDPDV
ncbi:hypothetical protein PLICRDRAFT_700380 [Plicaturopsis crispa FD-325 SS-3]|nr:hypothetical protein PLICRDRAFT_700380 [Plicaturopsis crispa FD-325 SS-3]